MVGDNNRFGKIQAITLNENGALRIKLDGSPFVEYRPYDQYDFWRVLKVDNDGHVICVIG